MNVELKKIQHLIDDFKNSNPDESVGELSDTYHSFNDLYNHRAVLTALAFMCIPYTWKSKLHDDDTMYDGMFIVGAATPDGMISYHYDLEYWDLFKVPVLSHAPKFTGYTEEDVLTRIKSYIFSAGSRLIDEKSAEKLENVVKNEIFPVFEDDVTMMAAYISFFNRT